MSLFPTEKLHGGNPAMYSSNDLPTILGECVWAESLLPTEKLYSRNPIMYSSNDLPTILGECVCVGRGALSLLLTEKLYSGKAAMNSSNDLLTILVQHMCLKRIYVGREPCLRSPQRSWAVGTLPRTVALTYLQFLESMCG